jgi:signal transduction histidine kinase
MALQLATLESRHGEAVRHVRLRVLHGGANLRRLSYVRAAIAVASVGVSATAIAFTHGPVSLLTPAGLFVALGIGIALGPTAGALSGAAIAAASALPILRMDLGVVQVATWVGLFPIVGVAGGMSERLRRSAAEQRSVAEERRRIARDLHDGVAQSLAHLRLELDLISRRHEDVRADADRLSRVAERALADVRSTLSGLRARRDLASALGAYLDDLQGPSQPSISFESSEIRGTTPELEMEVYRVAQEAVSNALRHANAHEVHVRIQILENSLVLKVEDDGLGIPAVRRRGVGMRSMAERAERLGAHLVVGARAGGGTSVVLEVPL